MMEHLKRRITIGVVGAFVLFLAIAAIPLMFMVNDKPAFSTEIDGTSQLVTPYKTYTNPIGTSAAGFNPKMLVAPDGRGCLVWMNQTGPKLYNNGTHLKLAGTPDEYLTTKVTATVQYTAGPLGAFNSISSWNVTTRTLGNLYQRDRCSFMDAAFDSNGHLIVFLSNQSVINGTVASYNTYQALLWNANLNTSISIENSTQNWDHFFTYLNPANPYLSARGASGQILYYGTNRHLLWNNGTHLRYKYDAGAVTTLSSTTYMGDASMVLGGTGTLHVVYSRGASIDAKQVVQQSKTHGGAFSGETIISSGSKECTSASVFIGAGGIPNYLWSVKENTTTNPKYLYIVQYYDGTSIRNVSTDHGGLTLGSQDVLGMIAYNAKGAYLNGKLNIFYNDRTVYSDYPSTGTNIVWQHYDGASFSENTFRIISYLFGTFEEWAYSPLIIDDDIIVAMYSDSAVTSDRFNFVKVDYTAPQVVVTSRTSLEMPSSYSLTWTTSENDLATISVKWDNRALDGVGTTDRSVTIPATSMSYGPHPFEISITDEIGNLPVANNGAGTVTFIGLPPEAVITIIIIVAAVAGVILFGLYYSKNRAKIMKRNLGLKLQGKVGDDTWDEDGSVDDDSPGSDSGNVDLKKDLKKVDM